MLMFNFSIKKEGDKTDEQQQALIHPSRTGSARFQTQSGKYSGNKLRKRVCVLNACFYSQRPAYLRFSKQQHPDHREEAEVEGQQQNDAVEAGEDAFRTFSIISGNFKPKFW